MNVLLYFCLFGDVVLPWEGSWRFSFVLSTTHCPPESRWPEKTCVHCTGSILKPKALGNKISRPMKKEKRALCRFFGFWPDP